LRCITKKASVVPNHLTARAYNKLAERVLGRPLTPEELKAHCKDNVNIGVLNTIMFDIKKGMTH